MQLLDLRQGFITVIACFFCLLWAPINGEVYKFALFWPHPNAAANAQRQFNHLLRPELVRLCEHVGRSLPADFDVQFDEFQMPTHPSYELLESYRARLASSSGGGNYRFAGSTLLSPYVTRLVQSMAEGRWVLQSVDPPPLAVMANSLLRVVKLMQLSGREFRNASSVPPLDQLMQPLVIVVGPPYSLSQVSELVSSFGAGVTIFDLEISGWHKLFDDIWSTAVTTILVLANRSATTRVISQGLDTSLWSPDYRWVLLDSALMYSVKENLLPANSRNITSLEFGPYTFDESIMLETLDQVMLQDLLTVWTLYLANWTCGVPPSDYTVHGLTGYFNVSPAGSLSRYDWQMQIFGNIFTDAMPIGNFSTRGSFNMAIPKPRSKDWNDILTDYRRLRLNVYVVPGGPYMRYKSGMANRTDIPLKDRLEGMAFDLCMDLFNNMGLTNLTFHVQEDLSYGSKDSNGHWSGLVASLVDGVADFACADLTDTADRRNAIDFTVPYYSTNISILYKRAQPDVMREMFQFVFPFKTATWLYLIGAVLAVAVVLALLHRISPNRQMYDLRYSIFVSFASLFQGLSGNPPDRAGGRLVVMAYWLFVLIILVSYVGTYAAIRTLARLEVEITTVASLLDQQTYTYGTLGNSSLSNQVFAQSTFASMKSVYRRMLSFDHGFFNDPTAAFELVKDENYAMIFDSPTNSMFQQELCDAVVTGHLENTNIVFGLPLRSDLKPLFDDELRKLLLKGRQNELYTKYFVLPKSQKPDCEAHQISSVIPQEPSALKPRAGALTLNNTLGLLIVNVIGCCITLLVAGIEHGIAALRRARAEREATEKTGLNMRRRSTLASILHRDHFQFDYRVPGHSKT